MTLDDIDAELVRRVTAMVYLGRRHPRSPGYYRDAGQALLMLRVNNRGRWSKIVNEYCHLGRRRAYQLMELAESGKTLSQIRRENSARVRKHRQNKWLRQKRRIKTGQETAL